MKRWILAFLLVAIIFSSCGVYQLADVSKLSVGMTPDEVARIMGNPVRKLSADYTQDGTKESFEYTTYKNESYEIEYWNGRLSKYNFMYDNVPPTTVVPVPRPPRPVYPERPRPSRPVYPERPSVKPGETRPTRPAYNNSDNRNKSSKLDNEKQSDTLENNNK